jgi:hypothetical protein
MQGRSRTQRHVNTVPGQANIQCRDFRFVNHLDRGQILKILFQRFVLKNWDPEACIEHIVLHSRPYYETTGLS